MGDINHGECELTAQVMAAGLDLEHCQIRSIFQAHPAGGIPVRFHSIHRLVALHTTAQHRFQSGSTAYIAS
jgi:hypothetical protein